MKLLLLLSCILFAALLFAGCGTYLHGARSDAETTPGTEGNAGTPLPSSEGPLHGVSFKEGKGLSIPPPTREILGLKLVDVREGSAVRRVELPLRVFKARKSDGKTSFLASGSIEQHQAALLEGGAPVALRTASGAELPGQVVSVEGASAKLTGLAEVVVQFPASEEIQMGAFLDGYAQIPTTEDVVLIPREALLKTAEGYFVYVVNGDSLFRTEIGVGGQGGNEVEVTEGLYMGDRVVMQPVMPLWLAELQAIRGGKACADGH